MNIRISKGGQISLPAEIRRRWATDVLIVEDLGSRVVLRPVPADPISEATGAFRGSRITSDRARARLRREERDAARRRSR